MPLNASLLLIPPGGVRLPVPPGVPPPTFGEVKPPLEEPPSPLEGVVSGIEPVAPFELSEALEPLAALEPVEVLEPVAALEPFVALEPVEFIEVLPVVALLRPPVVAVCAKMPSERPRKTALIILPSGPEAAFADGDMKARPRIL